MFTATIAEYITEMYSFYMQLLNNIFRQRAIFIYNTKRAKNIMAGSIYSIRPVIFIPFYSAGKELFSPHPFPAIPHSEFIIPNWSYSSICLPKKPAATCVSLMSVWVGTLPRSPARSTTAPITSPPPIMGDITLTCLGLSSDTTMLSLS